MDMSDISWQVQGSFEHFNFFFQSLTQVTFFEMCVKFVYRKLDVDDYLPHNQMALVIQMAYYHDQPI